MEKGKVEDDMIRQRHGHNDYEFGPTLRDSGGQWGPVARHAMVHGVQKVGHNLVTNNY